MNKEVKSLWKGDWMEIVSPVDDPYEIVAEDGQYAYVIPIKNNKIGIRYEFCPPYLLTDQTGKNGYLTLISGKVEEGESVKEGALRELREEAGVAVTKGKIVTIMTDTPVMKSTSLRANLFIVVIDECTEEHPEGDGTINEEISHTLWVTYPQLKEYMKLPNKDMLLYMLFTTVTPLFDKSGLKLSEF